MSAPWIAALERWVKAGLVDAATADRIRAWEAERGGEVRQSRLAIIVFALGGILLTAGILLFVAAHWDDYGPGARFALVLAMIGVLHLGGAYAARASAALSATLHAAGTAALGAGIYLSGQIFNTAEHWPGALMLWSAGAAVAVWLLRQWPQVLWLALLGPAWLWGEWIAAQPGFWHWRGTSPLAVGLFLLACTYLFAARPEGGVAWRRALAWLGAVALIPAALGAGLSGDYSYIVAPDGMPRTSGTAVVVAWALAILLPFALAAWLRGRAALPLLAALAWAFIVTRVDSRPDGGELALYALFAIAAGGIVYWGLRDQQRLAVNVGVLGFAITVLAFYFASVFDKLGRALGLIGIGVLFIGGGWALERARRRLIGRIDRGSP